MSTPTTGAPAPSVPTPTETPVDQATPDIEAQADAEQEVEAAADEAAQDEPAKEEPKKEAKAEKPSNKKKFKVKVDAREEDVELDLDNEDEIRKHLQLSKAAYKRMQESAEMRKGVQELLETLRTDPLKVLADPRLQIPDEVRQKMAESIISKEYEELSKTPEQREKERLQREYDSLRKQVEEERKAREEAEFQHMQQQQAAQLDAEISSAIAESGLPKNARTVRYFAEGLMFAIQNNINLSAKDLIPHVKKQTLSEFKEMVSSLPDEEFESWLGKDGINRIRKRSIQKAKPVDNPAAIKQTGNEAKKSEEPQKKIHFRDFMRNLGK